MSKKVRRVRYRLDDKGIDSLPPEEIAAILRGAGDALLRQFGTAAAQILHEALDDAQREIASSLGGPEDEERDAPDAP